jgi:hypothetical protein
MNTATLREQFTEAAVFYKDTPRQLLDRLGFAIAAVARTGITIAPEVVLGWITEARQVRLHQKMAAQVVIAGNDPFGVGRAARAVRVEAEIERESHMQGSARHPIDATRGQDSRVDWYAVVPPAAPLPRRRRK